MSVCRVLFVCMGNICRSPAGEAIFKHLVATRRQEHRFQVDSAGTIGYHVGKRADERMRAAGASRGYQLSSRARQVTANDLSQFDLVVAMDRDNMTDLLRLGPEAENVELLSRFLDDSWPTDVPDPYYGGSDGFEYVLDMIEAACPGILDHLDHES